MLCFHNENWGLVVHMSFKGQKKFGIRFRLLPDSICLTHENSFHFFCCFGVNWYFECNKSIAISWNSWRNVEKRFIYIFRSKKTSLKNIKTSNQLDYHSSCFGKTPSIICVRSRRNLTVVLITNKPYKAFLIYFKTQVIY